MPLHEIKNQETERYIFQWRLLVAIVFVLTLFAVLFSRLIWLQTLQYDKYKTLAEENRITVLPTVPIRGLIYDQKGVLLADNVPVYTLEFIQAIKRNDKPWPVIDALSRLIEISPKERLRFKRIWEERNGHTPLIVKPYLSDEEVARFAANSYLFPEITLKVRQRRHYPLGETASHILGYIGRINDDDLKRLEEENRRSNYFGTDYIGKIGLEQHYEAVLHGTTGVEEVEVDSKGRIVRVLKSTAALPGKALKLSVDISLQRAAETLLGPRRGAVVAIDPQNGGVLALVSMPRFDPNHFVDGIDLEVWNALNTSPEIPLLNRAVRGEYAPGSTFKPLMAMAALERNVPLVHQVIMDPGYFVYGNHKFRDFHREGRGLMNFDRALTVSSDTYYYHLAAQMGIDSIVAFMKTVGLGSVTGIDLLGERAGILPSPAWKKKRFKTPEAQKWYTGDTISIGIGQGYNAYTPLQMAQATAILARRGTVYRPHLVSEIIDPLKGHTTPVVVKAEKVLPWKKANIDRLIQGLVSVTEKGTAAQSFRGVPYAVAGKTGTAQVFSLKGRDYHTNAVDARLRDHSWFIAFAPAEDPKIALAVLIENGGFGAQAAAPLARRLLDFYLLGKPV